MDVGLRPKSIVGAIVYVSVSILVLVDVGLRQISGRIRVLM